MITALGRFIRTCIGAPRQWLPGGGGEIILFLILVAIGILLCLWAWAIDLSQVFAWNPCECGTTQRHVGFWSAVNWWLSLVILAPALVALIIGFANSYQDTLLRLQADGVLLDRESGAPVAQSKIEKLLNVQFGWAGIISALLSLGVLIYAVGYMGNVSWSHARALPLAQTIQTAQAEMADWPAACPAAQSEATKQRLTARYSLPSDAAERATAYPVVDACSAETGEEMDWSVAHVFAEPGKIEDAASWAGHIRIFSGVVTAYLFFLCAAIALSGFAFAIFAVTWLWLVEVGRTSFSFKRPLDADSQSAAFPVVTALKPVSVSLGGAALAAVAILYLMAIWNDYLRSFEHESFGEYVAEPFLAGARAAGAAGNIGATFGAFLGTLGSENLQAAAGFGDDRAMALFLAIVVTIPTALLAAFVRVRKTGAGPNVRVTHSRGWLMLGFILLMSLLSLTFVKFGMVLIGGMLILVLTRAWQVLHKPASD